MSIVPSAGAGDFCSGSGSAMIFAAAAPIDGEGPGSDFGPELASRLAVFSRASGESAGGCGSSLVGVAAGFAGVFSGVGRGVSFATVVFFLGNRGCFGA